MRWKESECLCFELHVDENLRRPRTIHSQPDRSPHCSTSSHRSSAPYLTVSHRHSQTLPNHPNQHPVFCQLQCSMCSSGERFLVRSTVCKWCKWCKWCNSVSLAGHFSFLRAEQVPTHRSTFSATKCGWNLCFLLFSVIFTVLRF